MVAFPLLSFQVMMVAFDTPVRALSGVMHVTWLVLKNRMVHSSPLPRRTRKPTSGSGSNGLKFRPSMTTVVPDTAFTLAGEMALIKGPS